MITSEHLQKMTDVKLSEVNRAELIDIKTVKIDTDIPIENRIENYIEKIKNPYCFLCDDIGVKIEFSEDGKTLDDSIRSYLTSIKNKS